LGKILTVAYGLEWAEHYRRPSLVPLGLFAESRDDEADEAGQNLNA